jgi:hypothetical protein
MRVQQHVSIRFLRVGALALALAIMIFAPLTAIAPAGAAPRTEEIDIDIEGVTEGQELSGIVTIVVDIDSDGVASVAFRLTGPHTIERVEKIAPYSLTGDDGRNAYGWDTATVPDGLYTLTITVQHNGGETVRSMQFSVANGGSPAPVAATNSAPSEATQNVAPDATPAEPTPPPTPAEPTPPPTPAEPTPPPAEPPAEDVAAPTSEPNPFAKPELMEPKTVYLSNKKPRYKGNGEEDVIIVVTEPLQVAAKISDVRNMVLIGGEFTITKPLLEGTPHKEHPLHRALGLERIRGVAYIEGIWVHNGGGGLSEGIQFWGSSGHLVVRNSRLEGIRTTPNDRKFDFNHPDFLQPINGSMAVENVTMNDSQMQAQFTGPEEGAPLHSLHYRNVNTRRITSQAWFFFNLGPDVVKMCDNCWHDMEGSKYRPEFMRTAVWPKDSARLLPNGEGVVWDNDPSIRPGTTIWRGVPPGGDFAPADKVGMAYDPGFFR